jgi:diguanylate cyclase (GGDEF)-like protein
MANIDLVENRDLVLIISAYVSTGLIFTGIWIALRLRSKESIQRALLIIYFSLFASVMGMLCGLNSTMTLGKIQAENSSWFLPLFCITIIYTGLTSASAHWFQAVAILTDRHRQVSGRIHIVTLVPIGLITIGLLTTPFWAGWLTTDPLPFVNGIAKWVSFAFGGCFELAAFSLLLRIALRHKGKQSILMCAMSILPLLGEAISLPSLLSFTTTTFNSMMLAQRIPFLLTIMFLSAIHRLDESQELFQKATRGLFFNLKDAALILDKRKRIVCFNAIAEEIFQNIHSGQSINEQLPQIGSKVEKLQEGTSKAFEFEINFKGLSYWVSIVPIDPASSSHSWIILLTDRTRLKQAEAQLSHNALHDGLTALPNRILLLDRLNHAIRNAQRDENHKFAILSLDLDHFKTVNTNLGHQAGDKILIEVAHRLQKCLRKVDTVARMEGDEFVILLEKISGSQAATEVALRVIELLSQTIELDGKEIFISASIGIAMGSRRHKKPDDILRDGDLALHQAKERGRCQYVIFDKEMDTHISTLYDLKTNLRNAIQQNELLFHYQPILSLKDQKIIGFEALIRWDHPVHGIMLPNEFLPEAEVSDLIIPIGHWGIKQACHDLSMWTSLLSPDSTLSMYVNLSPRELSEPDLMDHTVSVLEETGLNPSRLAFEIKEKMIMEKDPEISDILAKLKSIGVQIVIDQFGTGTSSLRLLPIIPIDTIKIDRSFIRNIPRSRKDYEIVQHIIELGRSLKIGVIAEGVEAPHEYVELKSMECDLAQGDYFYKPLPQNEVIHLLEKMTKRKEEISRIDHKRLFSSVK